MIVDAEKIINLVKLAAKEELLSRFLRVTSEKKLDGSIVTEADLAMQNRMQDDLLTHYPDTVLLSEEMTVSEQQVALNSDSAIWCLDPLDGTSNYASGISYFAVSLSLIKKGKVIMGLVYDPIRDECYFASQDETATLNGENLVLNYSNTDINKTIAIIDFKRLESDLSSRLVQQQPFSSQRNFGASALDWCWLAANRGQLYLHGKQNIWDYSAGNFIFHKAGGYSCSFDGSEVFSSSLEGRSAIAAVNQELLENWLYWLNN